MCTLCAGVAPEQRAAQDLSAASQALQNMATDLTQASTGVAPETRTVAGALQKLAGGLSEVAEKRAAGGVPSGSDPLHSLIDSVYHTLVGGGVGVRNLFVGEWGIQGRSDQVESWVEGGGSRRRTLSTTKTQCMTLPRVPARAPECMRRSSCHT
jgi:hypothetical protein